MHLVLYNLNTKDNGNKAVAIGPFKELHTVSEGELRMIPNSLQDDIIEFSISENYMFDYDDQSYTDLQIVAYLDGWEDYDMTVITPEQYRDTSVSIE